jgi:DNA-directed RNA polymerase beta subunit
MERDCLISHGAAGCLRERLHTCSDACRIPVCANPKCGLIANQSGKTGAIWCKPCGSSNVKMIEIPYAAKLLFQELYSMNIAPRIQLGE